MRFGLHRRGQPTDPGRPAQKGPIRNRGCAFLIIPHYGTNQDQHLCADDGKAQASDGKAEKSFDQLLKDASILDQFHLPYRRGRLPAPPAPNEDPGRFRNEAFFRKMYGDCHKGEIERRLVTIIWLPKSWGKPVRVTGVNGIAEKLKAVSAEIDALPGTVKRAAYPIAGVLACRPVRDTGRDSMHAYAAAIDLNVAI